MTGVPPRKSNPRRTAVAPWTKAALARAITSRARMDNDRSGRPVFFVGLVGVDIEAESRHQSQVCRKARREPVVVCALCEQNRAPLQRDRALF